MTEGVASESTAESIARHLVLMSRQLREAGDVALVVLDEEGVAPAPLSLADDLWLCAVNLDYAAAMRCQREQESRG